MVKKVKKSHKKTKPSEELSLLTEKNVKKQVKKVITVTKNQLIGLGVAIVVLLLVFLFIFVRPAEKGDIIVKINGKGITQQEIDSLYTQAVAQNPQITKELVLNQTIMKYLLLTEAEAQKITVSAADIDAYIANIEATLQQDVSQALGQLGVSIEEFRKQVQEQLIMTKLLLTETAIEDSAVSEDDMQTFYEENKEDLQVQERVEASHILVATKEEAQDILDELDAGAEFAELATEKSIDPSAKTNKGSLGLFQRGQMVPEFEEVAFSLDVGEMSEPVKTQFGYHIILVEDKEEEKTLSFEEVKENIKEVLLEQLRQEQLLKYIDELMKKANIKYY